MSLKSKQLRQIALAKFHRQITKLTFSDPSVTASLPFSRIRSSIHDDDTNETQTFCILFTISVFLIFVASIDRKATDQSFF